MSSNQNMNTMVLLLLSSLLLLLGVTAAEQPMVFGRSVARTRSSRLERIRSVREAKAPRVLIEDGFRTEYKPNDTRSMSLSFEFSMLGSMPYFEGSSMPYAEGSSMPLSRDFSMPIGELWTSPPTPPPSSFDTDVVSAEDFGKVIVSAVDSPTKHVSHSSLCSHFLLLYMPCSLNF
jgi:hypothetical protein